VWRTLSAPPLGDRAWLLGVAAVQVTVEDQAVVARLRAHVTGGTAPERVPIAPDATIHAVVTDSDGVSPPPPPLPPIDRRGAAQLELFIDGVPLAESVLEPADLGRSPPPRAFGHAFCRWLRGGAVEAGCDLTEFLSLTGGRMFERKLVRPLSVGQTVSYRVAYGAAHKRTP
jgi:hypothetical protein